MELDDRDRRVRFLLHDRDAKFPRAFDALLANEQIKVIRTPVQAPNANAYMEWWVGSVRRECLDRLLILGRAGSSTPSVSTSGSTTTTVFTGLSPETTAPSARPTGGSNAKLDDLRVSRRDLLGGVIHELPHRRRSISTEFLLPRARPTLTSVAVPP
jgi:putative transposase